MRKGIALVLIIAALVLILAGAFIFKPVLAQSTESPVRQWIGQKVSVQVSLGAQSGWHQNATLRDVTPEGILIDYEGKEHFIYRAWLISVVRGR